MNTKSSLISLFLILALIPAMMVVSCHCCQAKESPVLSIEKAPCHNDCCPEFISANVVVCDSLRNSSGLVNKQEITSRILQSKVLNFAARLENDSKLALRQYPLGSPSSPGFLSSDPLFLALQVLRI